MGSILSVYFLFEMINFQNVQNSVQWIISASAQMGI